MPQISTIVSNSVQTGILGSIPKESRVTAVTVRVDQAFNSSGTDLLTVGYDADTDAYAVSVDVSTVGVKTVTLGADVGQSSQNQTAKAYYTAGGGAPTTGIALVTIEYVTVLKIGKRLRRGRVARRARNAAVREIVPALVRLERR